FALPETADVKLDIYDIKGRKIATLADETLSEGEYERSVSGLASGIYLYHMEAGDFAATKKMVVK
ncbi:MAG: T9SS type A sorting domain-containing protein, partial [bacterium]|nr:T9SS type A sorting domain-containing protein [bacterium]